MSLNDRIENVGRLHDGVPNAPPASPGRERRRSAVHALVAAAREPMAVLDRSLRVTAANRLYYQLLPGNISSAMARPFCEPGCRIGVRPSCKP